MKFTKMEGCGNDYIYINGFVEQVPEKEKPALVKKLSDRHFGIGGDGVIFINPSKEADFEMEMYNADGSRAEMCGNGIRCVAKYVYDNKMTDQTKISIISAGQVKYLDLTVEDGKVSKVRVNMGKPILEASRIPVLAAGSAASCQAEDGSIPAGSAASCQAAGGSAPAASAAVVDCPIEVLGREYRMTCVSMGNPHTVLFLDHVAGLDLEKIGPCFEKHPWFPRHTNTEFVEVLDASHVFMRVWERGTGETLACGTGACATAVAGVLNGLTSEAVHVKLLGGELLIEWDREKDVVYMTGPAVTVFEGEYED